jgi:hypothetical protein
MGRFFAVILLFLWLTGMPALAAQLSQRALFPTANFDLHWQRYLSEVPLHKINLYTVDRYVMQPGFQLSPEVRAEVLRIPKGFRYSYRLANGKSSVQSWYLFGIARMAPVSAQSGGASFVSMGLKNPYGNAIVWYARPDFGQRTRQVDVVLGNARVQIPVPEVGIAPGEALADLSFESTYLPGIVEAFGRGKGWLVDANIGNFVPAPFNEYLSGKTVGPVQHSLGLDAQGFAAHLGSLVTEAVALGWLTGDLALKSKAFAASLSTEPVSAHPEIYRAFYGYLTGFWFGTSDMTSEGRSLMLTNLEYAMQRFPVVAK